MSLVWFPLCIRYICEIQPYEINEHGRNNLCISQFTLLPYIWILNKNDDHHFLKKKKKKGQMSECWEPGKTGVEKKLKWCF